MSFYLVQVDRDGREVPLEGHSIFTNGSEAGAKAKHLSSYYGVKVQPRRTADAPKWRPIQAQRIQDGTYTPFPAGWDLTPITDHFAHLMQDELWSDGTIKIRYVASEQDGLFDKLTRLNPGRYLQKFYPDLSDAEKRRLIALIDPPATVLFANTRDEIRTIYVNGPQSCMSHETRDEWETLHCHPVEAYAAGDLAIAYITNRTASISARTVCWPDKKLFGRLYGDEARLGQALTDMGYTQTRFFVGARIAKIPHRPGRKGTNQRYILPYFDNIAGLVDKGDTLVSIDAVPTTDPVIIDGGTSGLSKIGRFCPKLKDFYDGHFGFVYGVNEEWSHRAIHDYAFNCYATNELWPCESRVFLDDGQHWSIAHFQEHGFTCAISGGKYPNTSKKVLSDGREVNVDVWALEQRNSQRIVESLPADHHYKDDLFEIHGGPVDHQSSIDGVWNRMYVAIDRVERLLTAQDSGRNSELPGVRLTVRGIYDIPHVVNSRDLVIDDYLRVFSNALEATVERDHHTRHVDRPHWADPTTAEIRNPRRGIPR